MGLIKSRQDIHRDGLIFFVCVSVATITPLMADGRVHSQVLGDDVKAEEVTGDALPYHGLTIHVLMLL